MLAQVGPGSMLIGYMSVGVLCYAVMAAMVSCTTLTLSSYLTHRAREKWLLGSQYHPVSRGLHIALSTQRLDLLSVSSSRLVHPSDFLTDSLQVGITG
jgi:hypothetical protein